MGNVGERLGLEHDPDGQGWRAALGSYSAAVQGEGIWFTEGVSIQVEVRGKMGCCLEGAKKNDQMLGLHGLSGRGKIDTWLKLHVSSGTQSWLDSFSLCVVV